MALVFAARNLVTHARPPGVIVRSGDLVSRLLRGLSNFRKVREKLENEYIL